MKISLDQGSHFLAPAYLIFKHFVNLGSNTLHFSLCPGWLLLGIPKDAFHICDVLEGAL